MKFRHLLLPLLAILSLSACTKKTNTIISETKVVETKVEEVEEPKFVQFDKSEILIFQDEKYVSVIAEDGFPEPIIGQDEFDRQLYLDIKYPAMARENGTQGSVVFEIIIDEEGIVQNIKKIKSVSPECDTEAEEAIRKACTNNFEPYYFEGQNVKLKYLIPVHFRLR